MPYFISFMSVGILDENDQVASKLAASIHPSSTFRKYLLPSLSRRMVDLVFRTNCRRVPPTSRNLGGPSIRTSTAGFVEKMSSGGSLLTGRPLIGESTDWLAINAACNRSSATTLVFPGSLA